MGDSWCFIAVERRSKLILAFEVGKRTETCTGRFVAKLAAATSTDRFQLSSDGFNCYPTAVGRNLEGRVDYAQVIKEFAQTTEGERRYSPPEVVKITKKPIYGNPDERKICTSHIERQNGTLRQWCKRMTRLTYAFSKKWENHRAALALHFAYYNFCRTHSSIRQTPAMAAGLTDRAWGLAELLT
jgi:IS1 family transposase